MTDRGKKTRVLIAKPGLDGHDAGAKVVVLGLRDAGMEVIYTGIRQTPEKIAHVALQEDVDIIGLSCLSGAHKYLFPRVVELLRASGRADTLVIAGGNIPSEDVPALKESGVREVFGPGTRIQEIVECIQRAMESKRSTPQREDASG